MLALAACTRTPPKPAPRAVLPTLTRAVVTLKRPADVDRHGDIRIPRRAITRFGGWPGVFVLEHGRARFRLLKIGRVGRRTAVVLSGLSGDETLILPPFRAVDDGSPVHPVNAR